MPPGFRSNTLNKQVTLGPAFPPSDGPGRTVRAATPAALPITVKVVARRFGRGVAPLVQTAAPVEQTIRIEKRWRGWPPAPRASYAGRNVHAPDANPARDCGCTVCYSHPSSGGGGAFGLGGRLATPRPAPKGGEKIE